MKYLFSCDKTPRAHKSYEDRTGMTSRAAVSLAAAVVVKPETIEDEDGNIMRVWTNQESYTHADIASCLVNRVAVTPNEMLGTVPPRAIKYCQSKGWLVANASGSLLTVTLKGAIELDLPLRFQGGQFRGRKIPFLNNTRAAKSA